MIHFGFIFMCGTKFFFFFFSSRFIEIPSFTCHIVHPFKVDNPVVFSGDGDG